MSQCGRHVEQALVDGGERGARRDDEEWGRDECHGDNDSDFGVGETPPEESAEECVRANQVDEHDAAHQWWQRQRNLHDQTNDCGDATL